MPSLEGPRFVTAVAASPRVRRRRVGRQILTVAMLGPAWLLLLSGWLVVDSSGARGLVHILPLLTCAAALFWIVRSLVVRRQRVVTHLRRFGHTDNTVMRALRGSVRRHLRFVTLDDGTLPPMPTPWSDVAAAALRVPLTVLTLAVLSIVIWYVRQDSEGAQDYALVVGALATIAASILAACETAGRGIHARRRRVLEVPDESSVERVVGVVAALGGRRWPARHLMPRLVVARTADAVWRQAVIRACDASDALLVDVSSPSEHVLWELETVAAHRTNVVYIAAANSQVVVATASLDEIGTRVVSQLGGATVLTYKSADWRDAWRLGRQLTNAADNVMAASRHRTATPVLHRIPQIVGFATLLAIVATSVLFMDGL